MAELTTDEAKMQAETLQKMKDEAKELKVANRKKEKEKQKRITQQQDRIAMSEDTAVWMTITNIKEKLEKTLKSNKITSGYNLRSIVDLPNYYQYQHPSNLKLKSNNKTDDWVAKFLSNGGTEKQLMEAATSSRTNVWKRISWKRPKKENKTKPTTKITNKVTGGVG